MTTVEILIGCAACAVTIAATLYLYLNTKPSERGPLVYTVWDGKLERDVYEWMGAKRAGDE